LRVDRHVAVAVRGRARVIGIDVRLGDQAVGEWLEGCASGMYKIGYPYAVWIVRENWFGLRKECTLQFLRERPRTDDLEELYGPGVLRASPASF